MKKIAILILLSMSATAIADKNTNFQGQTQYTKSKATGIGIGHSSSKSKSSSGAIAGSYSKSGGNKIQTTDKSNVYAPGSISTGGATHGVNIFGLGFQWKNNKDKAYTAGFLSAEEQKENYCKVTLSIRESKSLDFCQGYFKPETVSNDFSDDPEDY